jgi:exo-1,4-beta-D-glucosaminidase
VSAGTSWFAGPAIRPAAAEGQHPGLASPVDLAIDLNQGWAVRSSVGLEAGGMVLSLPGVDVSSWYTVDLPSTVLGALIAAGRVEDPFFGTNLLKLPGQGPPGKNFSNHPMPDDSPFRVSWWFRKEFNVPEPRAPHTRLQFDGINYRANIWFNGQKLAGVDEVVGAYRDYEFDVTALLGEGRPNVAVAEVFPPEPCDLGLTWVDWNPSPPDKNMGLWRDVWLRSSGPVALRSPQVTSKQEGADGRRRARLTIAGDLLNVTDQPRTAVLRAAFDGRIVRKSFEVPARTRARAEIGPDDDAQLIVERPRLWWPHTIGSPELYDISLDVTVEGLVSDASRFAFGIRDIRSELTTAGHARFSINEVPILIRGAGWATDLFLRRQPDRDQAQLEYVKAMGLNAIRFEGMLERSDFLDLCDRAGILVIAGWCCCDCWEKWDTWSAENHVVAPESLRSQIRRVRRHPCLLTWWYGSDFPPPEHVERRYLEVLAEEHWPNPFQSSATHKPAPLTGPSGLKMRGPYDWVPPNYWLEDTEHGGAFGFATEISPGPAVPPIESLRKMIPAEHLWPIGQVWNFHAGVQEFQNIRAFTEALNGRYGPTRTAEEFAELSQLAAYEGQRAMFEGYARNRARSTGVIQWMLNNAWPSVIWHLFDYYLRPGGGFFGTQRACEPLHVMYAYDDQSVVVINDYPTTFERLRIEIRVVDLDGKVVHTQTNEIAVQPVSATTVAKVSPPRTLQPYFVDLRLRLDNGVLTSRNFYWLPTTLDVLDTAATNWIHTPVQRYADLSALRNIPAARLDLDVSRGSLNPSTDLIRIGIRNPTDRLAFFAQLRLADRNGEDVLPVVWSDNYLSLLPGERRTVDARIPVGPAQARPLVVEARGLNVPTKMARLDAPTVRKKAIRI